MRIASIRVPAFFARVTRGAAVVAAAATMTLAAAGAPASAADSGDGNENCNNGEICFQYTYTSNNWVKHFYNGANHNANGVHGAYIWWSTSADEDVNIKVMDNAAGFRNRDTQCWVYLFDVDAHGAWFVYNNAPLQQASFVNIGANRNNGHNRCTQASPVNK